jgi:ethanolamine utilization protein EutM
MMKDALGIIETEGLVAAIEAADAMLKAASVRLLGRQKVKGGLQAVMVAGDVAAVKAATEAGAAACQRIGRPAAVHVIPRPVEGIETMLPASPVPDVKAAPEPAAEGGPKGIEQTVSKRAGRTPAKRR